MAMKCAVGQINPTIGDFSGNREKILAAVGEAASQGASLVVFPEMSLCGYPPMDLLDHHAFVQENLKELRKLQKEVPPDIAVLVGYVDKNHSHLGKPLQNVVSVIHNGRVVHTQAKTLLPSYDVFDEARYFEPAGRREVFEFGGKKIGIAVCEDLWWEAEPAPGTRYPLDPVRDLLDAGAELIIAPSASPFFSGKIDLRRRILAGIGKGSGVPVVYANLVGGNDSLIFDGNSLITGSDGTLIFRGKPFEEEVAVIDIDARHGEVKLEDDTYGEIYRALTLGIKDYLAKCGFSRVHLGLSGGVDSAVTAVLAAEAIGPEKVDLFALPSRYSSDESLKDAEALAGNLGIPLKTLSIEEIFSVSLDVLAPHFGGKEQGLAEENLQARIRGTLLMSYSNKWDSLLLTTGNKSELAVGYCTLYGDMCGSIAVIGDVLKTEVYELCRYINREREIIPRSIIDKPPSAELRPDQKDEDSLPPYELLDGILTAYLLQNKTREELVEEGHDACLVERILKLVARSEYKRRQAPPVLKVSPRAFGTGRRMPIARSVYES